MSEYDLLKFLLGEFSWGRLLRSSILIVVCVYLYFLCYGIFISEQLIFQPHPSSYRDDERILKLTDADGNTISARYLPNPAARFTILFSHGNAEDIGDVEELLHVYRARGFSIISYDYSGYGTSTGKPSEAATYANIRAVYSYLRQQRIEAKDILLLGRSLGSGPSVELATQEKVGGLILASAFTSVFRTMTRVRIYPVDKYDNLGKLAHIDCPVLIMHGRTDGMIPFWHAEQLFNRARSPKMKFWVTGANHDQLVEVGGESYWETLQRFARQVERNTE